MEKTLREKLSVLLNTSMLICFNFMKNYFCLKRKQNIWGRRLSEDLNC